MMRGQNICMKRILVLWYTYGNNFGDVLIYNTIEQKFKEQGYYIDYMEVGLPCNKILYMANEYDFLLFAGGGIIERYVPNVLRYFQEDFEILKVPYGVMGISIGTFAYTQYEKSLRFFVDNSLFFYSRDQFTADYFNALVKKDKVICSADVVFGCQGLSKLDNKSDKIGFNFRDVPYKDLTGDMDWNSWEQSIMDIGADICIPDSYDIRNEMKQLAGDGKLLDEYRNSSDKIKFTLQQIRKCRIIIGMRFHVVLAAACIGIIPIPITYCPKVERLACQLGLESVILSMHDQYRLKEKVEYIFNNEEELLLVMNERTENLKYRNDEMFKTIFEILKKEVFL